MTTATKKTCQKCNKAKATTEFNKQKRQPDGLYAWCRDCAKAQSKKARTERDASPHKPIPLAEVTIDENDKVTIKTKQYACPLCDFRDGQSGAVWRHGRAEHPGLYGLNANGSGPPRRAEDE